MGGKNLLPCALLLITANSAFGIYVTFKLRAEGLVDQDATAGRQPGADGFVEVYVNRNLLTTIGRGEDYTINTANVDWKDSYSLTVNKNDEVVIGIRDFNGVNGIDLWHGHVQLYLENLEKLGQHKYPIRDGVYRAEDRFLGTLIVDVLNIKLQKNSPCPA